MTSHHRFSVSDCGLFLNSKWSHIGAFPVGVTYCEYCGKGVTEVKCPYCYHDGGIVEAAQDRKFCLKKDSDGVYYLDHAHAY